MRGWHKRRTLPILSLTAITLCKIAMFIILFRLGYVEPYVGGSAANYYLPAANSILTTGAFYVGPNESRSSKIAPGYPAFLALVQWVASRSNLSLVVCIQMVFDWAIAILLLRTGRLETSIDAGWLAAVMWLVFPPAVVMSTWIASESLFATMLVLSMAIAVRSLSRNGPLGLSLIAGVTLGAATLVRGTTQLFPVFFLGVCLARLIWVRDACRYWLRTAALLLVGMCIVVLPWTARNLRVLGEPVVVQTGLGSVFLAGSRREYFTIGDFSRRYTALQHDAAADGLPKPTDGKQTSEERWLFSLGLREYRIRLSAEPWWSLPVLVLHKSVRLWYGTETGAFNRQLLLGFFSLLVVPAGVFQLWLWRKRHHVLTMLWGSLILYFFLLSLVNLPMFRYALPLYPFLIFAAAHRYLEMWRHRENYFNISWSRMKPTLCCIVGVITYRCWR